MGSGPSGNPPLHINILYCMLLMCLQVVNKRSLCLCLSVCLSLSLLEENFFSDSLGYFVTSFHMKIIILTLKIQ